ncbi:unnamed protein product [Parnassius apollo]|uniref:(apollo) hypothetical protein n=1 Tax=Parnassius apollo TaxID=110799 RepID=A0A8S3XJX3_PARAO|nr:unnamed protein product [Parnassius apollo]
MLAISWTQKILNLEVLQVLETVKIKKLHFSDTCLSMKDMNFCKQHPRMDGNRDCCRALLPREEQEGVFEADYKPSLVGKALEEVEDI